MKRVLQISLVAALVAACSEATGPVSQSHPSFAAGSGASFTGVWPGPTPAAGHCSHGPGTVNCNLYDEKDDVALNAGPTGASLDDGTYFFAVLSPGGQADPNDGTSDNLSDDVDTYLNRTFTVSGSTVTYVPDADGTTADHAVVGNDINLFDYANTTNPGGVYILAICAVTQPPVDPSTCKYDAFKVGDGGGTETGTSDVTVTKYYDANGNGVRDGTEPLLAGWLMEFHATTPDVLLETGFTTTILPYLTFTYPDGSYKVVEQMPNEAGWFNSDPGNGTFTKSVTISDAPVSVTFGNYCRFQGVGARTIGYWKTHQAATSALLPVTLYGSLVIDTWAKAYNLLNGANSQDANVMLKAQLLGAVLNVKADAAFGNAIVAGTGGKTVNGVIADAQAFLVANWSLVLKQGSALRTQALALKTLLDGINNSNEGGSTVVVNPTPCAFTFGTT